MIELYLNLDERKGAYLISGTERYGMVPFRNIKVPKLRKGIIPGNLGIHGTTHIFQSRLAERRSTIAVVPTWGRWGYARTAVGVHKISKLVLQSIGGVYGMFGISYMGSTVEKLGIGELWYLCSGN